MLRHLAFAAAVCGLLSNPVLAQEDGVDTFVLPAFQGMAVSQAPEAGLGVCFGPEAKDALDCAVAQCMTESGLGEADCAPNLWCFPHGWAADIFIQHNEGPHWHKFVCDRQSREQLDALVAMECAPDYLMECAAVRIWDPEGNELLGPAE